jgi:hypothetical protein
MNSFRSWSIMRILRLLFGVIAVIQAAITFDFVLGLLGLVVGGLAFFNVGCCGSAGCDTNDKNVNINKEKYDVEFEEVVAKQ